MKGFEFDGNISSFSSDLGVAGDFSKKGMDYAKETSVVFELVEGTQGLPIQNIGLFTEYEWIAGGRFRVESIVQDVLVPTGGTGGLHGGVKETYATVVKLIQIAGL